MGLKVEKKRNDVFGRIGWTPYFHENKHALHLIEQLDKSSSEGANQQECYKQICLPPDDLESQQLGDQMEQIWLDELKMKGPAKASLARSLFRLLLWDNIEILLWCLFGRLLMAMIMLDSIWKLLIVVLALTFDTAAHSTAYDQDDIGQTTNQTLLTKTYETRLNELAAASKASNHHQYHQNPILAPIVWLFLANCVYQVASLYFKVKLQRCGLKCRVAMTELVGRKSLRLHLSTSIQESSGRAIGLISNDVSLIETAQMVIYDIIMGPVFLVVISAWLAQTQVGWQPVVCAVPVLVTFIFIQLILPKFFNKITVQRKGATSNRIDAIGAFLSSIKIVKMYAWEPKFKERVQELRAAEMKILKRLDLFNLIDLALFTLSEKILSLIVYLGHLLIFKQLAPQLLFITTLAFSLCKCEGFMWFSSAVKRMTELLVGVNNVQQYLILDEFKDSRIRMPKEKSEGAKVYLSACHLAVALDSRVSNGSDKRKDDDGNRTERQQFSQSNVLAGIDLDLESGDRVFVVGAVGTGKSTLLLTLLGETRLAFGHLSITEGTRFAYAAQEPCVFPDSIKNNILNGRAMDADRYQKVISVCSLAHDLSLLSAGDETIVGPKGVSLSGGQKARLSLARAVYSQADIYLLDDPLSAVDGRVANDIFTNCICNFLAGKLVVLATHQLQFLSQSNKVVVLDRDQKSIFGPTKQLMEQEARLKSLLADFGQQQVTQDSGVDQSAATVESLVPAKVNKEPSNEEVSDRKPVDSSTVRSPGSDKSRGSDYMFMLKCACTPWFLFRQATLTILCVCSMSLTDYYYIQWSRNIIQLELEPDNIRESANFQHLLDYTLLYLVLILVTCTLYCVVMFFCRLGLRNGLQHMHNLLTESLFKAKLSFYDYCNTGELTSRYAGDFGILDQLFVPFVSMKFCTLVVFVSSLVTMVLIKPLQLIPIVVSVCLSAPIVANDRDKLIKLRDLNRSLQAPVYTSLTLSIDELSTIRSEPSHRVQVQQRFQSEMNQATSMSLLSFSCDARMGLHLKYVSLALLGSMLAIFFGSNQVPHLPTTGTFLMIALTSTSTIPLLLELWFFIETVMISVRHVRMYTELESETDTTAAQALAVDKQVVADEQVSSCAAGKMVEFKQVTMRYAGKRPALDGLSFAIKAGERVGIVGRTGAGKSSIVSVLYRLYPFEGSVEIDGVDTKRMRLAELRASLGVIPQDPVLFPDTLRKNLDPFEHYSDSDMWRALRVVNLAEFVSDKLEFGLDQQVSGGGRNFSVGQRQLVCLARAVLRSPRVLLIDEATANVDSETDSLIQRTIREHFKSSTIITIAHRLNTVLDFDRIMVLDSGRIVEFDSVTKLLELDGGQFKEMLEQSRVD